MNHNSLMYRLYLIVFLLIGFSMNLNAQKIGTIQIFGSMYHIANQEIPADTLIFFAEQIKLGKLKSNYDVDDYPNKKIYISKKYSSKCYFEMTTANDSLRSLFEFEIRNLNEIDYPHFIARIIVNIELDNETQLQLVIGFDNMYIKGKYYSINPAIVDQIYLIAPEDFKNHYYFE